LLAPIVALIVTGSAFAALDFVWLSSMSERLYRPHLGDLMRDQPALGPAISFYAIYVLALVFLVVLPAIERASPLSALLRGAVFGFAAYATYNLTNLATLRDWPLPLVFIDNAWGTIATGSAAFIGAWLTLRFAAPNA
jgi:uncharacterized membrane protein